MHHDSCPSMHREEPEPRRDQFTINTTHRTYVFEFKYQGFTIHAQNAALHPIISVLNGDKIVQTEVANVEHALQWVDDVLEEAIHFDDIECPDAINLPFERGRFAPDVKLEKIPVSPLVFKTLMQNTPFVDADARTNLLIIDRWAETCFIGLYKEGMADYIVKIYDMRED